MKQVFAGDAWHSWGLGICGCAWRLRLTNVANHPNIECRGLDPRKVEAPKTEPMLPILGRGK